MSQPTWAWWMVNENGDTLADLSLCFDRTASFPRRGQSLFQGKLPITSAAAAAIPDGLAYIKGYRIPAGGTTHDEVLRFYGPLEIDEVSGGDQDIVAITAYDPGVILASRYTGNTYSSTARGSIIKAEIDAANVDDDTGIRTNSANIETTASTSVDWTSERPSIASVIDQFAEALDGCDIELRPIELSSGKIADLYVYQRRGDANTGVRFSYGPGTDANCTAMRRTRNRTLIGNEVIGYYGAGSSVDYTNPTSINTYRLRQTPINLTGETQLDEAQQVVSGYIETHYDANAVAEYAVTTGPRAPRLWDDFDIGDTVTLDFAKSLEFTVEQRVEAVTIAISDEGVETFSEIALRGAL